MERPTVDFERSAMARWSTESSAGSGSSRSTVAGSVRESHEETLSEAESAGFERLRRRDLGLAADDLRGVAGDEPGAGAGGADMHAPMVVGGWVEDVWSARHLRDGRKER